jgi:DNA-binding winged helix-turn-helix (wHTH) protein
LDVRPPPIRFGIFEVDLASGELRKQGVRIKLQEQPFQALVALIEHPGEVLTREELQQRLWPAGTFVDFDRGLNKAINRLREALGDDADNPGSSRHCLSEGIDFWRK